MNMTITESDRRVLSVLAAFILAIAFALLVFRPIMQRNEQLQKEISQVKEQENAMNIAASLSEDRIRQEQEAKKALDEILVCFYPMLQSQEAENMLTVLMLNHSLQIQNMSITVEETPSTLQWYQYSRNASQQTSAEAQSQSSDVANADNFGIYTIRLTCSAEGSRENLMALVDDISINYPAISILSTEWSVVERQTQAEQSEESEDVSGTQTPVARTETTGGLTISLEIYMYRG